MAALNNGGQSRELLEAILSVGRALSATMVAEGIEEPSQMTTLEEMGCEMARGFLMGKPCAAKVIDSLLAPRAARCAHARSHRRVMTARKQVKGRREDDAT